MTPDPTPGPGHPPIQSLTVHDLIQIRMVMDSIKHPTQEDKDTINCPSIMINTIVKSFSPNVGPKQ